MIRTLAFAAVATLLPMHAPPAPAVAAATTAIRVVREYGDGPVTVPRGVGRVQLLFHGQKGDKVRLQPDDGCPVDLRAVGGAALPTPLGGLWRLPAKARYVFTYSGCHLRYRHRLQLEKLVVHRVVVDGRSVRLPARRGYLQAVALRVPTTGRVQLAPTSTKQYGVWNEVFFPDLSRYNVGGGPDFPESEALFFEAGHRIFNFFGALPLSTSSSSMVWPGQRLLVVTVDRIRVRATSAIRVATTVDGAPLTITNGDRALRETQVEFDGTADQWVTLERTGESADSDYRFPMLLDPNGDQVLPPPLLYQPFWQLPVTGHYRVMVPTTKAGFTAGVRMRAVRVVDQPMPLDGSPLTLSATTPGEWVLATFSLAQYDLRRLHLEAATMTGDWQAVANVDGRYQCYGSPNDCGSFSYGTVDATQPDSTSFGAWHPTGGWVVVLEPTPGVLGQVTVSLQPGSYGYRTISRGLS